ncbi:Aldo/keto reductase [Mycena kentingensis (nom. inval.)]|nr:Aldo/keto reductase [Mycena kentingensis (nom. inval.)]
MTTVPSVPKFKLNTGAMMPAVSLGSWMGSEGERPDDCAKMVELALKLGYRAIDTATRYGVEAAVGRGIKPSGVPREEIFLTTKLHETSHHRVSEALEYSLKALQVDYIDLWLMHWPVAMFGDVVLPPEQSPTIVETYKEMEKALATGKVRAIGVSNFSVQRLAEIIEKCSVVPAVNQIETHPSLPQFELVKYGEEKGILTSAYSPLGEPYGKLVVPDAIKIPTLFFEDDPLQPLADKYKADVGSILLSWNVQRGVHVNVKAEKREHLIADHTIVALDAADVEFLNKWHEKPGFHRSLIQFHSPVPGAGGAAGWTYEQLQWPGMKKGGIVS